MLEVTLNVYAHHYHLLGLLVRSRHLWTMCYFVLKPWAWHKTFTNTK